MNSKELTAEAGAILDRIQQMRRNAKRVQFIEESVVDRMQDMVEQLSGTIVEICEEFDCDDDRAGFSKPGRKQPAPLYDTIAEKKQALEGP